MWLSYVELAISFDSLTGSEVKVHCRLLVDCDDSFLASDYEAFCRRERIPIIDNGVISQQLLATMPAFGGGECIYDEDAWIKGVAVYGIDGAMQLLLKSCRVCRDSYEVTIGA